ncbi:MAG: UpxY family transcription antiterminator [Chitinophagales bacterium]|nr:UpxY family transcription antiterminator [Chitinophagales bacterium]
MSWYVLYTKSRNEKKVAKRLEEKGIEVYCPLREEVRQWSDRKKKVAEPVFRSYLFVNLADYTKESVEVLYTPGTVRFLWWNNKPGIVRKHEIEAIKSFLNDYKDAEITVTFKEGEKIVVNEGPLKDARGKVLMIQGNKAVLHLHSLGLNMTAKLPLQSLSKSDTN